MVEIADGAVAPAAPHIMYSDMPDDMKDAAVNVCVEAVRLTKSESEMAFHIKKTFDEKYPDVKWNCIVGRVYGGFFTHDHGSFIHVQVGKEVILLFRAS